MGVQLKDLLVKKEIAIEELKGRKIAIDAFNWIYQFLSIIRDRDTQQPLRNSKGQITSHISGIFYRTSKLIENGIKPIWVFDGKAPDFKIVSKKRKEIKENAKKKFEEAVASGNKEEARIAAQQTATLTSEMIEESKTLLTAMGVPVVQAPSEGEAQCAYLCKTGKVYVVSSQDADSLLFGTLRLLRNLSITGRRKIPRKMVYMQIKPEIIELKELLANLDVGREQLIILGMLVGTDFNPGISGIGPKRALELVKKEKTLENVLAKIKWDEQFADEIIPAEKIYNFFLEPPVSEYEIKWPSLNKQKLREIMIDGFEFSKERVDKVIKILEQTPKGLDNWIRK